MQTGRRDPLDALQHPATRRVVWPLLQPRKVHPSGGRTEEREPICAVREAQLSGQVVSADATTGRNVNANRLKTGADTGLCIHERASWQKPVILRITGNDGRQPPFTD